MNVNNSQQINDFYKNLIKHANCSKCNIVLTPENYKKDRSVCKLCYNNYVSVYYKNKFSSNSISKIDSSTQTDYSNELNKQTRSKKRTIFDYNPNLLCNILKEILSKSDMTENDYTISKMILDELLITKSIPKK